MIYLQQFHKWKYYKNTNLIVHKIFKSLSRDNKITIVIVPLVELSKVVTKLSIYSSYSLLLILTSFTHAH